MHFNVDCSNHNETVIMISSQTLQNAAPGKQMLQSAGARTLTLFQKKGGNDVDRERRDATIRKLKAEEIRGTLKPRLTTLYDL